MHSAAMKANNHTEHVALHRHRHEKLERYSNDERKGFTVDKALDLSTVHCRILTWANRNKLPSVLLLWRNLFARPLAATGKRGFAPFPSHSAFPSSHRHPLYSALLEDLHVVNIFLQLSLPSQSYSGHLLLVHRPLRPSTPSTPSLPPLPIAPLFPLAILIQSLPTLLLYDFE